MELLGFVKMPKALFDQWEGSRKAKCDLLFKAMDGRHMGFGEPKIVNLLTWDDDFVYLPRLYAYKHLPDDLLRNIEVNLSDGSPVEMVFNETLQSTKPELKKRQDVVVAEVVNELQTSAFPFAGGIVQAPCGCGKTIISGKIASIIGRTTLVLIHKEFLRSQFRAMAVNFLGLSDDDIGYVRQKKCVYKGKKLVIGMIQSICRQTYPEDFYRSFGLIIMDECFHPSQELLTTRGWVTVDKITQKDLVAQVDAVTKKVSFAYPEKVISRKFKGALINIRGSNCDLLATPEHQHLIYWDGKTNKKVSYQDFSPKSRGSTLYAPCPTKTGKLTGLEQLKIAYQADGTLLYTSKRSNLHTIRFSFRRQRKIDRLLKTLSRLDYRWKLSKNKRGDTNICVWVDFIPCKKLDWVVFDKSGGWYKDAISEIVEWDGWRQDALYQYESDWFNASVVQAIGVLAGYRTVVHGVNKRFRVTCSLRALRSSKSLVKNEVPYNGKVHCVRMEHGTVIARRNGKVTVTGNCHRAGAPQFNEAIPKFNARYMLGLTATPRRKDGLQGVFHERMGKVLSVMVGGTQLSASIYQVKIPCHINEKAYKWKGTTSLGRLVSILADTPSRNVFLAGEFIKALKSGRRVMVFSDRREHLTKLRSIVEDKKVSVTIGNYWGGLTEEQLKRAASCDLILSTYSMASEALDIPEVDTLFLATPKSDVEQAIGRILRSHEGKKVPIVVDIVDDNEDCIRTAFKRLAQCRSLGYDIKKGIDDMPS